MNGRTNGNRRRLAHLRDPFSAAMFLHMLMLTLLMMMSFSTTRAHGQDVLIPMGADWLYFKGTEEPSPDTEWRDLAFDDSLWLSGPTGIGYADGDDATVLDDMQGSYTTVYLRHVISVPDPGAFDNLVITIDYDDGFVMYINGSEVARRNAGAAGTILPFDATADGNHEAGTPEAIDLAGGVVAGLDALETGDNIVAVQLLNTNIDSSDLTFNMQLAGNDPSTSCPTDLTCTNSTDSITLSWTNNGEFDTITVTRNGAEIAGSPFGGATDTVVDSTPGSFNNTYEVIASVGGFDCPPLSCTTTPGVLIFDLGAEWKFFRGSVAPSDPPAAWREVAFDDTGWESGPTGIGYGDGDDATVIDDMEMQADDPATPDVDESVPGYLTLYLRKSFTADPAEISTLAIDLLYDDGVIVYINGQEAARTPNMGAPGEEFTFDQTSLSGHEANNIERFNVDPALLASGANLIAAELHNTSIGSSDASFNMALVANACAMGPVTCTYDDVAGDVTLSWPPFDYSSITVLRNGVELNGSPFAGDVTQVIDQSPSAVDTTYEVIPTIDGTPCTSSTCMVDCSTLTDSTLTCTLGLAGGATQAELSWQTPPGTASIEVEREGTLIATLDPSETSYIDPDVEADEPENDTEFTVSFIDAGGETCSLSCGPLSLCPENFACDSTVDGGTLRAELTWENVVKEWTSYTVERDGEVIATGIPGDASSFLDTTAALEPLVVHTYTLIPVAPVGEEVGGCEATCTVSAPVPEIGPYEEPAGGWDTILDFGGLNELSYSNTEGIPGNLDGNWIRAVGRDSWDGSEPGEIGAAPDGEAPGGIELLTLPGGSECGDATTTVLHLIDPGDPTNPGGSLDDVHPDPYTEPNNRQLMLGLDLGAADRNVLRDGATISVRWRITPPADSPAFMNASATGDGAPLAAGLGQLGLVFLDDGSLGTAGAPASLSLALQTGDQMQMSTEPASTLTGADIDRFRTLWITVQDGEADDTYDITTYLNGGTTPFAAWGTLTGTMLQAPAVDFGSPVGNYLIIGAPGAGPDADVQIDYIAYKEGVHPPAVDPCEPQKGTRFIRGDNNSDGGINIADPIFLLNSLFGGGPQPSCREAADINDDGGVNIADPIFQLNAQFGGGPQPPAPNPTCGLDPDLPGLGCASHPPCN